MNLARGLFPIEKWTNAFEATNGNSTKYTGSEGYAFAKWPTAFTIDLREVKTIRSIRFLLWDGMGEPGKKRSDRRYQYGLLTSKDEKVWENLYETGMLGYNGWQVFNFDLGQEARYVKIDCQGNTANEFFHLVEFEIDDEIPSLKDIEVINYHNYRGNIGDAKISNFLSQAKAEFEEVKKEGQEKAEEIEKLRIEILEKDKDLDEVVKKLNISGKALDFSEEAKKNKKSYTTWLIISIVFVCILLTYLYIQLGSYGDFIDEVLNLESKIKNESVLKQVEQNVILIDVIRLIVLKLLITSILIYIVVFCSRNYFSSKHNYTINTHKALSLVSALDLINRFENPEIRNQVIVQAAQTIFSHQKTGYSGSEVELSNPNIITSVVENVSKRTSGD